MRRRAASMAGFATVALCGAALLAGARRSSEATPQVVIRGAVRDESGAALASYPVRLIKTKTILNLFRLNTGSQQLEEGRVETGPDGTFELRLVPDPKYDYFYLRFYDPKTFDPVHYQVPGDVDITRRLKQNLEVVIQEVIRLHPEWPRVQELVAEFGADSNRGKILRALGLPERRETLSGAPGRENWWYYAKGICYQLLSDDILRVRRYDPVLPPGGS